jgi:riboflavin biosynthesis pyrimidine reductase
MKPLARLFEREGLPSFPLPTALAATYGGDFGLHRPAVYANFVSSVDGVVSLPDAGESGRVVSGDDEPDRFIMGLLRACADAVLIGAGTFRKAGGGLWHPETVFPAARALFADLRRQLGLRPHPLLVVVTASGNIDLAQPALHDALVITTPQGEKHMQAGLPSGARVAMLEAPISGHSLLDVLHTEGLQTVLVEGGPTLLGQLLKERLIHELFLTIAPRLFGRSQGDGRKSLVEGIDVQGCFLDLLSVRGHDLHLYLRYALQNRA